MIDTSLIGKPFECLGGALIDPAMIVPAALPLDLSGESVRARLCMFTDHNNRDMALRPDLTLPVALHEIAARKAGQVQGENVHRYHARAFRQPGITDEPMEFVQIGFERFGALASPDADAQTYLLVAEAAAQAGAMRGIAQFGDLAILPAFIAALNLSSAVGAGLKRAFRQAGGVSAFLERASLPRDNFVISLAGLEAPDVAARLQAKLAAENIQHFGNRTQSEVITRLMDQASHALDDDVPEAAKSVLERVLALTCGPAQAGPSLRAIAIEAGLSGTDAAIDALEARFALIAAGDAPFMDEAQFSPAFGRRFTYYDGFVFEIAEPGARAARPFGAGGRYDHLLSDLSLGEVTATAIGGTVRPDRLALATRREDGQ